jgi:hypothetical protein
MVVLVVDQDGSLLGDLDLEAELADGSIPTVQVSDAGLVVVTVEVGAVE